MVTKHTLWKIIAVVSCIVLLGILTSCEIFPQAVQFKYDANGATEGNLPSDSRIVKENSNIVVAENSGNLKKTNHRFIGWNTAPDGKGMIYLPGESILITGPTILYAQWIENNWRSFRTMENSNGEVEILDYFGTDQEVFVPEEINGKPVVTIADGCFKNSTTITYVELPDSIKEIGKEAFSGASSLTGIQMGSSIEEIGANAFLNAKSLKKIVIPDKVTKLEPYTFVGCDSLQTITIGASLTSIDPNVYIYNIFYCPAEFIVSEKNPYMTAIDGVLYDKAIETLIRYPKNKMKVKYEMPPSVREIAPYAFAGLSSRLVILILSPNLERINEWAFLDCQYLKHLTIPDKVTYIGQYAFRQCYKLQELNIPMNVEQIEVAIFKWCYALTDIYCEANSKPEGWNSYWNSTSSATIHWGYTSDAFRAISY